MGICLINDYIGRTFTETGRRKITREGDRRVWGSGEAFGSKAHHSLT